MAIADKMWDAIGRVIPMDARVEGLAATVKGQQPKIEDLTGRIIRLDPALEIAFASRSVARVRKQLVDQ